MIRLIVSGVHHVEVTFRPIQDRMFAPPGSYLSGTGTMTTLLRKYNTSLLTFAIYLLLIAFALACSLGAF